MTSTDANTRLGRLVFSPPASGSWNMALDQALLETVQADNIPILRFYHWREPTVSLGYFQSLNQRQLHHPSLHAPLVRRATGGGAIIHDRELTYSLCLPSSNRFGGAAIEVYQAVHQAIIQAAAQQGVFLKRYADMAAAATNSTSTLDPVPAERTSFVSQANALSKQHTQDEPFLCFQRRTDEDLILSGYKIVGSAQRRSAGAMLQHGSILLQASDSAPELPGIIELTAKSLKLESFKTQLTQIAGKALNIGWLNWVIPESIEQSARLIEKRFLSEDWTLRRP